MGPAENNGDADVWRKPVKIIDNYTLNSKNSQLGRIKMREKLREQKGFTLLEIAIVLVIIGLIIGGVLKGQAILADGKIKKFKADVDGIAAAVMSYQDKYSYLPGDDPVDHFSLGATGNGGGTWNNNAERVLAWRALIAAGYFSGDPTQTTEAIVAKKTPYGSPYLFNNAAAGNYIYTTGIERDVAELVDIKFDDGIWNSGDIRANQNYTNAAAKNMYWYVF
jgi:prepilin-type N-terminal cleavage/methylation domain-containing protein